MNIIQVVKKSRQIQKEKNESSAIDIKFERTLFALITAMIVIFLGMVIGYFVHRRK